MKVMENSDTALDTKQQPWFLYMIECQNNSIYTGITVDVAARYNTHVAGKGARYTRAHPPKRLLVVIEYANRSLAAQAECRIKNLTPQQKRQLAADQSLLNPLISRVKE